MARSGVYLIHIENGDHYIGWAEDIDHRLGQHDITVCYPPTPQEIAEAEAAGVKACWSVDGPGAKFLGVINYKGLTWKEARVWLDKDRHFERWLKNWKGASRFCPECMGPAALNRANKGPREVTS